jgi:hypothetical protein
MKYNQESRKQYLESELIAILTLLGIAEEKVLDVTFRDIRKALNQVYPLIGAPEGSLIYPSYESVYRDRSRIMNNSRHVLYELNAIRSRETNVN